MAVVTRYPVLNDNGWTNSDNAKVDDGLYATATPAKSASSTVRFHAFNAAIPAGSVINSVTIEVQWKVSTTGSVDTLAIQAYKGTTAVGTAFSTTTLTTADTISTLTTTGSWSVSELNDNTLSGFIVQVKATRGNTNTAFTASLDFVRAVIDYTPPVTHILDISCPDGHGTCAVYGLGATQQVAGSKTIIAVATSGYKFDHMTIDGVTYTTSSNVIPFTADTTIVLYFVVDNTVTGTPDTGGIYTDGHLDWTAPYNTAFTDNRLEYLLLASELLAAGLCAGNILKIGFQIGLEECGKSLVNFRLRLKLTNSNTLTSWDGIGLTLGLKETVNTPLIREADDFHFHELTTPFYWDGVGNLIIDVSRDDTTYADGGTITVQAASNRAVGYKGDDLIPWDFSQASAVVLSNIPVTKLVIDKIQSTVPVVGVVSHTRSIISQESGVNKDTITFKSDKDLLEWEARADGAGRGQGLLVGSGTTLAANVEASFDVDCFELTNGDKDYRIDIYGRNAEGWSIYG